MPLITASALGLILAAVGAGQQQTGMPFPDCEAKVQAAANQNLDTDVLPSVHAASR